MKSKLLLVASICIVISSCVKDYYSHPDDKDGILTKNNYVYTDDIKRVHLETLVEQIKIDLVQLDPIIDKVKYTLLLNQLTDTQNTISEIAEFRDSVFKRRPPPPPCPSPQNCIDWLGVQYLTQRPGLDKLQMVIYDSNQNIIAQTEGEIEQLTGLDVPLDYVVLIFQNTDYIGDIQIKVIETTGNVEEISTMNSKIGL